MEEKLLLDERTAIISTNWLGMPETGWPISGVIVPANSQSSQPYGWDTIDTLMLTLSILRENKIIFKIY